MTVTVFCGCYVTGICLLWADFRSQHYWLWVTPDARDGWAMSSERIELMGVPRGGCLSFGQGIVSKLTIFKIHPKEYMFIKAHCTYWHFHPGMLLNNALFEILSIGRCHQNWKKSILSASYWWNSTILNHFSKWNTIYSVYLSSNVQTACILKYCNAFWGNLILQCPIFFKIKLVNNAL